MDGGEGADVAGDEECIFCHQEHKEKPEKKLRKYTFKRDDDELTTNGRTFIKGNTQRSSYYPRDDEDRFVSPLEDPAWSEDQTFKTYVRGGRRIRRAEKYQPPPIQGYIAAPHHMVAICCMNGTNKLPGPPHVNPWAKKGDYNINNGGNCIFLPSSASQFFVAYYYWKVRHTGRALQGHLGAHRKTYFKAVWRHLQNAAIQGRQVGWCDDTEEEEDQERLAKRLEKKLHDFEEFLFHQIGSLRPKEEYRLGAESYIEIPDEDDDFHVPADVQANLQRPYEILPKLDE